MWYMCHVSYYLYDDYAMRLTTLFSCTYLQQTVWQNLFIQNTVTKTFLYLPDVDSSNMK